MRLSQLITDSTEKQQQASDVDRLLLSEADKLSQAPLSVRTAELTCCLVHKVIASP